MKIGAKTVLFLVVASLANVLVTVIIFALCLGVYSLTLAKLLGPEAGQWAIVGSLLVSMVGTYLLYKKLLGIARSRYNLDEIIGISGKGTRR
jgi:ABC-type nickel/cobalt efflux system permease component RcnA